MNSLTILMVAVGTLGDVQPLIGLGANLRSRGHRVTVLANRHFEPLITGKALEFAVLGSEAEYATMVESLGLWEPLPSLKIAAEWLILRPMRQTYEWIRDNQKFGKTLVIAQVSSFGARIAQERLDVPVVTACLQPMCLRSDIQPVCLPPLPVSRHLPRSWNRLCHTVLDRFLIDPLVRGPTNAFRAEVGLAPIGGGFTSWSLSPTRAIGLFPDWYAPPRPDWPGQLCLAGFPCFDASEATIPPELESFLSAGSPPIVFTPGSGMSHGRAFFEAAVDACRRLKSRGILVSRYPDQIPLMLPRDVIPCSSVPFSLLLPRAAAAVHHGGIGTVAECLRAGILQVVMPMAFDQHDNAEHLKQLAVSRTIRPRQFRGPRVSRLLNDMLNSDSSSRGKVWPTGSSMSRQSPRLAT